jgi:cellulose synthase operon protein C
VTGTAPEKIRAALDKAIEANPSSIRSRLALINHNVRQRDGGLAVAAAQAALNAFPNDIRLLDALGVAERVNGNPDQAVAAYKKAVQSQPENAALRLRLAQVQTGAKDYEGAVENLRKALALKPELTQGWGELAKVYVLSGRPEAAIAEAKKLQKDQPNKAIGYALEGEVFVVQKKWPEAAAAFRQALSRDPAPFLAARNYLTLQGAGKSADATAFAQKWMKDHPDDATLPQLFAEQSQRSKDFPAAITGYKRVLAIDSDNLIALNNLAWLLASNKDPAALGYAEQAHALAPFSPNVLDTLGFALVRNGEAKRAVEFLRMASSLAPGQDDIRLHLAEALAASGDKAGARKEIAELMKPGKASAVRTEAEKLQATL